MAENFDEVSWIMSYEAGELEDDEIIEGFQHLIDSGLVWQLQGSYARAAVTLINHGHCTDHKYRWPHSEEMEAMGVN